MKAIEDGADVNETSLFGFTPLMFAALLNDDPEIIRILLEKGSDIDAETEDGMTALMWALMTETQDHTAQDMSAALVREENRRAVAMELIKRGANANAVCYSARWRSWTPLLFAALDPDRNSSIISLLIDAGANVEARTGDELTPLILAATYARAPEAVHYLIKAGANVNVEGKQEGREGWTPLLYALNSPYKSFLVIKELVLAEADVNLIAPNCDAPLFFALNLGDDPAFVELLLDAGANISAVDRDGNLPFDCALAKNYRRVARVLSKAAKFNSGTRGL
jgi:ankyrin repeat protein